MKLKRALLLLFLLVAGMVCGALLASVCETIPGLSWMAFSRQVGISPEAPFVLDLSILRFSFGFSVELSVAQLAAMALAIVGYNVITKRK